MRRAQSIFIELPPALAGGSGLMIRTQWASAQNKSQKRTGQHILKLYFNEV